MLKGKERMILRTNRYYYHSWF